MTELLITETMPLIPSTYHQAPFYMLNGHFETVIPSLLFKIKEDLYKRQRLELSDGDFIDIDWICNGNKKCVILTHGLEGDSGRYYMKRSAKFLNEHGWDVAAWNCRSCSGEMNRLPRFYHHGDTPDLDAVVTEVLKGDYKEVLLMGYSMGGSMSLKYLGETKRDERIIGACVYSVPCNLRDSAVQLKEPGNRFYEKRFLKKLLNKMRLKAMIFSDVISLEEVEQLQDFDDFHDKFTAPLHGFNSKEEFFVKATCDQFLPRIDRPVLIVNAANDPMLGEACYPKQIAEASDFVYLEIPKRGGHVGFTIHKKGPSYMELRTRQFLKEHFNL
jgi:predicted alpha/beta-fold hydrolase